MEKEINIRLTKIPRSMQVKFNIGEELYGHLTGRFAARNSTFTFMDLTGKRMILDATEIYGHGITFIPIS